MKKLVLLTSYFLVTPVFVALLIFYQIYLHQANIATPKVLGVQEVNATLTSVNSEVSIPSIESSVRISRIETLEAFFKRYNSPLEEFATDIVDNADKYGLDYRLLPAIAMQESTLCLKAPRDTNNCWGFGIYGKKRTAFPSLADAIETISRTLAREYHAQGLIEPVDIMSKYTPSNSGEWAENVSYVMDRIESTF